MNKYDRLIIISYVGAGAALGCVINSCMHIFS